MLRIHTVQRPVLAVLAALVALVLAVATTPLPAHAAALEAGQPAGATALGTQANKAAASTATSANDKQAVYVITSITHPDASKKSGVSKLSYKYNDSGLLLSGSGSAYTLTYSGVNLKGVADGGTGYTVKSSGGKVKSMLKKSSSDYKTKWTFTYNNSKKLTKRVETTYTKWSGGRKTSSFVEQNVFTTAYTLTKGLPTKAATTYRLMGGYESGYIPTTYKYDAKGNTKLSKTGSSSVKFANSYDELGRLATRAFGGSTYTFKYKKLSVSAAAAKVVAAQQWSLVNGNMNGAFGLIHMGIGAA